MAEKVEHHILSVLVENRFGVLTRVAGLFARRGFNIHSLAVSETEDPKFSRMTIVVDSESAPLEQVKKQLFKLIPVLTISEIAPGEGVERELMLVTVQAAARDEIASLAEQFGARVVDEDAEAMTFAVAGEPTELDRFTALLLPHGIAEQQRTGRIALPKLDRSETPKLHSVESA